MVGAPSPRHVTWSVRPFASTTRSSSTTVGIGEAVGIRVAFDVGGAADGSSCVDEPDGAVGSAVPDAQAAIIAAESRATAHRRTTAISSAGRNTAERVWTGVLYLDPGQRPEPGGRPGQVHELVLAGPAR